jgi:hypothetical protein
MGGYGPAGDYVQPNADDKLIHHYHPDKNVINPYIEPSFSYKIYKQWSLAKTIVLVIVLLGLFYLALNLIFQNRLYYKAHPEESNMNPPELENRRDLPENEAQ